MHQTSKLRMSLIRSCARVTSRIAFRSHLAPSKTFHAPVYTSLAQISINAHSTRSFSAGTKPSPEANVAAAASEDAPEGAIEPMQPDPVAGEVVTSDRVSLVDGRVMERGRGW